MLKFENQTLQLDDSSLECSSITYNMYDLEQVTPSLQSLFIFLCYLKK